MQTEGPLPPNSRDLLDHAPLGIYCVDRTARILHANGTACRRLQYRLDELTAMRITDVDPRFRIDRWEAVWDEVLVKGPQVYESIQRTRSGQVFPTQVTIMHVPSEGGETLFCYVKDISERKRNERVKDALYAISEAVHSTRDLHALFLITHDIISGLMPAQNFYIAFHDPGHGILSYPYHADEVDDDWSPHHLGRTLSALVLKTGRAMLVPPDRFSLLVDSGEVESFGSPCIDWLGAPLTTASGVIGVMAVQTYSPEVRLTNEHLTIFEFISTQVAMAIERKRSDDLLRSNEERYRVLVDNSPDLILSFDLQQRVTAVNPAFCSSLGRSAEEIVGHTFTELGFSPDQLAQWRQLFLRCITTAGTVSGEAMYRDQDGSERIFNVALTPLHDPNAVVVGASAICHDITDIRLAHRQLGVSEARYRSLIETSPDAIMLLDMHGVLQFCNRRMAEMFGQPTADALHGVTLESVTCPVSHRALRAGLSELMALRQMRPIELELLRHSGVTFHGELNASLVHAPDGEVQIMAVLHDITTRKHAEAELRRAKEQAELSDRLKDAFIANISHEIRTPLNSIMGYISLMEMELADRLTSEEAEYFESVHRSGKRLMRTVESVLNLASMESGTFHTTVETVNIVRRVEYVVSDLQALARKKDIELEFRPECPEAMVSCDVYTMDQALINIIDNAIKFTSQGGVTVRLSSGDGWAQVEVRDTGVGIGEAYFEKLYNAFSQEEIGYTRSFQGLGLGLALTKRYVDLNNGSISVASTKGVGSTFTITLPLDQSHHSMGVVESLATVRSIEGLHELRHRSGRLLVVEDDEQSQNYMRAILSKQFELHVVDNAADAWEHLMSKRFDLVLMDISIQGDEDGLQLTKRIRSERTISNIPVVALTAHAFPRDKQMSFEAGCNDYMTKPFMRDTLKNMIVKYVHG